MLFRSVSQSRYWGGTEIPNSGNNIALSNGDTIIFSNVTNIEDVVLIGSENIIVSPFDGAILLPEFGISVPPQKQMLIYL